MHPNPYSPADHQNNEIIVAEKANLPWRRIAALAIALGSAVPLVLFVRWTRYGDLELILATMVWGVACLPLAGLVARWGLIGFIVGIPLFIVLVVIAVYISIFLAFLLGIEIMPVPN